jgi:hypothetical protein
MLNRNRTMSLLKAYGLGPNTGTRSIIHTLWEHELMAPKSGSCFGTPLHAYRGVRQGDIISPIIFNVV